MENNFELETLKLKDQVDAMLNFSRQKKESFGKYDEYSDMAATLRLLINHVLSNLCTSRDAYALRCELDRDKRDSLA